MNKIEKMILVTSHILRGTLVLAAFLAFLERQWATILVSILALVLSFVPAILAKNYKITLPLEFEFIIIFFIYASLFLGEVGDYYDKYWWWDTILHTISGILLGIIGFLFIYLLNKDNKTDVHLSAIMMSVFAFSFALSIGALWEIFEYAMDTNFGLNMQKSGLKDTMWDLIADSVGAFTASVAGYFYVKKVKTPIFHNFIEKFVSLNSKKKRKIRE